MRRNLAFAVCLFFASILPACGADTPSRPQLDRRQEVEAATPSPTSASVPSLEVIPTPTGTTSDVAVSCADLDATWGKDWPAVLDTLERLVRAKQTCGAEPLLGKKYAAHFTYGVSLEKNGDVGAAVAQYRAALLIDSQRQEALDALIRLNALPQPTPAACHSASSPRPDPAPPEAPDTSLFITAQADQLQLKNQPFKVKGVNYYPRQAPWGRFLEEANPAEMAAELDVIRQAGFNALLVFLRYEPLFTCQPEDAIPDEAVFAKVDALFQLARERELKLIVTLNDLPDLTFRPLYTDWAHYDAQTVYIVRRYRNEPAILAWDLRNEGDLDYGARSGDKARFSRDEVIGWLAHVSQLVRANDASHLLTAGWWGDPTVTAPYVDILSFHHWSEADELQARLNDYRQRNSRPLMLQEVGYSSWIAASSDQQGELSQADILGRVVKAAEAQNISGWVVWTAFDFAPQPGQPAGLEHFFGLWRVDLTPKPALGALPLHP